MLQITNMSDYDSLHGFLYELRPSVRKEVEKIEWQHWRRQFKLQSQWVLRDNPTQTRVYGKKRNLKTLQSGKGGEATQDEGMIQTLEVHKWQQHVKDIPRQTRLLQVWTTTISSRMTHARMWFTTIRSRVPQPRTEFLSSSGSSTGVWWARRQATMGHQCPSQGIFGEGL